MKKITALLVLLAGLVAHGAMAQNVISLCTQIPGSPNPSCQPVSKTSPMPMVAIGSAGATAGYVYTSNGPGVAATFQATPAASITISPYSVYGNNTGSSASGSSIQALTLGTPSITDTGVLAQLTSSVAGYNQVVIQNTSNSTSASSNYIVNNNLGTSTTYYGDFGINSSTFTGTGSLALPNATYLYSQTGDLVMGTNTSNAVHFVVNNGATDAMFIGTSGSVGVGTSSPASALDINGAIDIKGQNGLSYPEPQTVAIGGGALNSFTPVGTGQMVVIGYRAGYSSTTAAQNNVLLGWNAGQFNTTGSLNDAMGHDALGCNQTGTNNTALGEGTMYGLTTGGACILYSSNYNTAVGASAMLYYNGSSGYNTAVGQIALGADTTGDANTCVGQNCLGIQTTPSYNVAFGGNAGDNITTGGSNLMLGFNAQAPSATASNQMNIDGIIYGSGVGYPNASGSGKVSIGTTSSGSELNVYGGLSVGTSYVSTTAGANGAIIQGNVGIGTSSAGQQLEIYDSSGTYPQMQIVETVTNDPAWLTFNAPTGGQGGMDIRRSGTQTWFSGMDGNSNYLIYDQANGYTAYYGVRNTGAAIGTQTMITGSALTVRGHIGFSQAAVPTVSSCGSGTAATGSTDNKGQITGVTAATACTITFSSALPAAPACTITGSVAVVSPSISAISTAAVTFAMTAFTGTLYYHCL